MQFRFNKFNQTLCAVTDGDHINGSLLTLQDRVNCRKIAKHINVVNNEFYTQMRYEPKLQVQVYILTLKIK